MTHITLYKCRKYLLPNVKMLNYFKMEMEQLAAFYVSL